MNEKGVAHASARPRRCRGPLRRRLEALWGKSTGAAHLRLVLARELPVSSRGQPSEGLGLAKRRGLQVTEKLLGLLRSHTCVVAALYIDLFVALANSSICNRVVGHYARCNTDYVIFHLRTSRAFSISEPRSIRSRATQRACPPLPSPLRYVSLFYRKISL